MKRTLVLTCAGLLLVSASTLVVAQGTQPMATPEQIQTPAWQKQTTAPAPQVPAKKGPPQAKSQEEYTAYTAVASEKDLAAAETAADAFVAKFPKSELSALLYAQIMQKYYSQNKPDKTIDAGRKALAIDPTNPLAAAMVSTALGESTRDTDLDREEKYVEALRDAESAVKNIDNLVFPTTLTPQQITDTKNDVLALAHASMGYIEMARKNYGISEQHLKDSLTITTSEPDPINYLRLSVVQDNQKKYSEALVSVNKAVDIAEKQNNSQILILAKNEKDRLTKLAASTSAPKPLAPVSPQAMPPKN